MSKGPSKLQWGAISLSLGLHLAAMVFVVFGHVVEPPQEPAVNTVKVRMVMLPTPVPPQPEPQAKPIVKPKPKPVVKKTVKPKPKKPVKPVIEQAKFAKKRVEEKPKPAPKPIIEELPKEIEKVVEKRPKVVEPLAAQAAPVEQVSTKPVQDAPTSSAQAVAALDAAAVTQPVAAADKPFNVDQYKPVQKIAPQYPRRALNKNIEGICTVAYTVNEQGRVESLKALDDCHPYFIKPSLKAAKTFQYSPHMVNGSPVKVPNVKNAFHYKIE